MAVLLLGTATPAWCQDRVELAFRGGVSAFNRSTVRIPSLFVPVSVRADFVTGPVVGVTGTRNFGRYFGVEGHWLFQNNNLRLRSVEALPFGLPSRASVNFRVHQLTANGVVYFRRAGVRFRPYATGGVGTTIYQPSGEAKDTVEAGLGFRPQTDTRLAWTFGGGVKVKLTRRFLLRWDVSDSITTVPRFGASPDLLKTSGRFHNVLTTVGASVVF